MTWFKDGKKYKILSLMWKERGWSKGSQRLRMIKRCYWKNHVKLLLKLQNFWGWVYSYWKSRRLWHDQLYTKNIKEEHRGEIDRDPTKKEVKEVNFSLNKDSASGFVDFLEAFFQNAGT